MQYFWLKQGCGAILLDLNKGVVQYFGLNKGVVQYFGLSKSVVQYLWT